MSTTLGRLASATVEPPPTAPADRRWRRRGMVTAIFVLAEIAMIRRTPGQLAHRVTNNLGDPALVIWTLRWGGHALVHNPTGVFNGNIFWPYPHTLAYADPLLSLAPVYALSYWLSGNFTLSLNLLVLGMILLNLAATYSLTRWLTRTTAAGVLAALAFGFSAFGLAQLGHPQLELLFPLPLGFLLLFKLLERPRLRIAVSLGLINIVILLGALYWAALYAVSIAVILVGYAVAERGRFAKPRVRLLAVVVAITALSVPALIPYYQVQHDHPRRPLVEGYGLKAKDVISPIDGSYLYRPLAKRATPGDEHRLFPGFLTMILAVVGLAAVVRAQWTRRRGRPGHLHRKASPASGRDPTGRARFALMLVAAGGVAVVLALGGTARGVKLPWRIFYWYVPGFGGVRVTARLGVLGLLAGAVLAGYGLRSVIDRFSKARVRLTVALLAAAAVLVELAAPLPWATLPQDQATLAVYRNLSHRPAGAVAELPMANPDTAAFRWDVTEPVRMVWATVDYHPRLNGYSGYTPPTYDDDTNVVSRFPSAAALARLHQRRVRYVILHMGVQAGAAMYSEADGQRIIAALPPGVRAERFGDNYLIDLAAA